MGHRNHIVLVRQDGTIIGTYCHWGAFEEDNGALLNEHFTNAEDIEKMILDCKGGMSDLGMYIEKGAKYDDGSDMSFLFDSLQAYSEFVKDDVCIECVFMFDVKVGVWYWTDRHYPAKVDKKGNLIFRKMNDRYYTEQQYIRFVPGSEGSLPKTYKYRAGRNGPARFTCSACGSEEIGSESLSVIKCYGCNTTWHMHPINK